MSSSVHNGRWGRGRRIAATVAAAVGASLLATSAASAVTPEVTVRSTYFYGLGGVARCNAGETAIGGGVGVDIPSLMYVSMSEPTPNAGTPTGWKGSISRRLDGTDGSGAVYAVCATGATAPAVTARSTYFYGIGGVARCNAGETAIGGGVGVDIPSLMYVSMSEPTPNAGTPTGWKGSISRRANGTDGSGAVYAVCAAPAPPPPPATTPPPITQPATTPPPPSSAPSRKSEPMLRASGTAKRVRSKVRIKINGELDPPAGVSHDACEGTVALSVRRNGQPVITRTLQVDEDCEFALRASVAKSKIKSAKKLALRIAFRGNDTLAATTFARSIKVKR